MFITHVKVKNWRNFREVEFDLTQPVSYLIGPNASGKSNLIDVFRFLRDIAKPAGGGLQQAVAVRGGMAAIRCGYAGGDPEVRIEITLSDALHGPHEIWRYGLGFRAVGGAAIDRVLVTFELVQQGDTPPFVSRPDQEDENDPPLLTETHLEQTRANAKFRSIADTFSTVSYLHVVPQLIKHGEDIGGNRLEGDPFGQGLMDRIGSVPDEDRRRILGKIGSILHIILPEFASFIYGDLEKVGRRRFFAELKGHGQQLYLREDQFSDGTLRLFGILWSLLDGKGLLLIEEPELSLHTAVVEQLPALIARAQRDAKHKRQVLISTHSEAMLSNPGIDAGAVIRLVPGKEGSDIVPPTEAELDALKAGFSVAEAVLPNTRPKGVEQLSLW
jgi:hypothetical protein